MTIAASYFIATAARTPAHFLHQHIGTATIAQFLLLSAAMLVVWQQTTHKFSEKDCFYLLLVGVIARCILVPVDSYTSSDISRYLFDGKLLLEGFDPYRVNHQAEAVQALRNAWQPPAEHAKYVTLYPPAAITLFAAAASFGLHSAFLAWKLFVAASSLAILLVGNDILKITKKQKHLPLLALSPLLILEAGIGAHLDSVTTLFVTLALWAWLKNRALTTGLFIGAGALVKFSPLVLLLPVVLTAKHFKAVVLTLAGTLLIVLTAYSLALFFDLRPLGSLAIFFEKWRFGSPLFTLLERYLSGTALLMAVLLMMFAAWTWVSIRCLTVNHQYKRGLVSSEQRVNAILALMTLTLATLFFLSPVVFPWYLMPLIPLLAVCPRPWLLVWTLLAPLSYQVLNQYISENVWEPATWPLWAIGCGVVLSAVQLNRGKKT